MACGGPLVTGLADTDVVNNLGGVCWFGQPVEGGTLWTTVDRQVAVTVTVPGAADGSAQSVIPFSPAIGAADPVLAKPPTGCNP